jgi:hypothetical protein
LVVIAALSFTNSERSTLVRLPDESRMGNYLAWVADGGATSATTAIHLRTLAERLWADFSRLRLSAKSTTSGGSA